MNPVILSSSLRDSISLPVDYPHLMSVTLYSQVSDPGLQCSMQGLMLGLGLRTTRDALHFEFYEIQKMKI